MISIREVGGREIIKVILMCLVGLIVALAVFSAGMFVGFHKAKFSYQWGDNYQRIFGMPREMQNKQSRGMEPRGPMRIFGDEGFINPNSAAGTVIKTDTSTLFIKGDDNVERNIIVNSSTVIMQGHSQLKLSDLRTDDKVVILGSPSSTGQVEAKLIRVFNSPPVR